MSDQNLDLFRDQPNTRLGRSNPTKSRKITAGDETHDSAAIREYLAGDKNAIAPLFLIGDSLDLLRRIPSNSVDFCMTSPPYWQKREYLGEGIGLELDYNDFIKNLLAIFAEVHRVLKPTGSFWLNIGDSYHDKDLVGIPWRLAIRMKDEQGWVLRNSVVWNKVKGGLDNTKDRLGNVHEPVFHFVKDKKLYFYDADAIRKPPAKAKLVNGAIVSATGVSGIRYKRQIELSTSLSTAQKRNAFAALEKMLGSVQSGEYSDFRMIIRGQQRATHSDSAKLSGRAKELEQKGFYFLKYHPKGSKPRDVWDIIPEDTQSRELHFAPYPEDLCKTPILATCPPGGVILDPFCGTGTTMRVAMDLKRRSIGIDRSAEYVALARKRCGSLERDR